MSFYVFPFLPLSLRDDEIGVAIHLLMTTIYQNHFSMRIFFYMFFSRKHFSKLKALRLFSRKHFALAKALRLFWIPDYSGMTKGTGMMERGRGYDREGGYDRGHGYDKKRLDTHFQHKFTLLFRLISMLFCNTLR
jgi:hypothetical protein